MTIMDAINKEIDGIVDYMLMMESYAGQPADFLSVKNGKRYVLMLREIPDEEPAQADPVEDEPDGSE